MSIDEIKKISIYNFLKSKGIMPEKVLGSGTYALYQSPLRNDANASFKVDFARNVWCDFGQSTDGKVCDGGTIIDLVMKMYNVENIPEVVAILNSNSNDHSVNPQACVKEHQKLKIIKTTEIRHPALIRYYRSRHISDHTANSYLKEVHYQANNKSYFALGFQNDQGGWELRNQYFKGSSSPKFYTYMHNAHSKAIDVFEGCFDFLSFIEIYNMKQLPNSVLVMNSCSFVNACLPILKTYDLVNCYLDNDPESKTGTKTTEILRDNHPNVIDQSKSLYPDDKDLNDFLCRH